MKNVNHAFKNAFLCFLGLTPVYMLLCFLFLTNAFAGALMLGGFSILSAILALVPAYVGSYSETTQMHQVGGMGHGSDPNPDKEYEKEVIRTGHRFPLRLMLYLIVMAALFISLVFLPSRMFIESKNLYKLLFMALLLVCAGIACYTVPSPLCMWDSPAGIITGFVGYFAAAVYLHFAKRDVAALNVYICVCAFLFLLLGCLSLNRAAIGITGGKDRVSGRMKRKNRILVISLVVFISAVAFIEPVRDGTVWLLKQLLEGVKWFFGLFKGKPSAEAPDNLEALMGGAAPMVEESGLAAESGGSGVSVFDNIVMYGFLGIVVLGAVWLVIDKLVALVRKLSKLFESFAASVGEGYYDEKVDLTEEGSSKLKTTFRDRIKKLFARETPWEKLTGRDKARRLVKELYKKRGTKISSLRTLTAREALSQMQIKKDGADKAGREYDKARYSSRDVDSDYMDSLRKEIKP